MCTCGSHVGRADNTAPIDLTPERLARLADAVDETSISEFFVEKLLEHFRISLKWHSHHFNDAGISTRVSVHKTAIGLVTFFSGGQTHHDFKDERRDH
jgi:hypothetical protein